MKSIRLAYFLSVILTLTTICNAQHQHSDEAEPAKPSSENSNLIDEFGALPHCDLTGRYDLFLAELSEKPESHGYVLIYQGKGGLPAYYDDPPAGRMFRNHLMFRRFDPGRVTVINAGFQEDGKTQLWIVPAGAEPPTPESTVRKPKIPKKKTFLFDRAYLALEEEDLATSEFVLPSVKADREAEQKEWEEEARLERIAAGESEESAVENASDESVETPAEESETEEVADAETPDEKYSWVSESFGRLLSDREGSRGVIIFYADDEHFDIAKVQRFVEEGVEHLSAKLSIENSRIRIVFGGYRNSTDVEYWVVPKRGKNPEPTPAERTDETPEETLTEN